MRTDKDPWRRPFNTPLESGLRSLAILVEQHPDPLDLQRLLNYDYLVVHSGDVDPAVPSLHPPTPHRSGELLVRRALVEQGLRLMVSRGLVSQKFGASGILYSAGEGAAAFLSELEAPYTRRLVELGRWVVNRFGGLDDPAMDAFVRENLDRWGSEFDSTAVHREHLGWQ